MNHLHDEIMAEFRRQELLAEKEQIRLEQLAAKSRVYHPGIFTCTMHGFAGWMISTGKELHERYEIPTAHSHRKQSGSLAR